MHGHTALPFYAMLLIVSMAVLQPGPGLVALEAQSKVSESSWLQRLKQAEQWQTRLAALQKVGYLPAIEALADQHPRVRAAAAHMVGRRHWLYPTPVILLLLTDHSHVVRRHLLRIWERDDVRAAATPILLQRLQLELPERIQLSEINEALAIAQSREIAASLCSAERADRHEGTLASIKLLAYNVDGIDGLINGLKDPDVRVRRVCLKWLLSRTDSSTYSVRNRIISAVARLVHDSDTELRLAAATQLRQDGTGDVRPFVLAALRDRSPAVRTAALLASRTLMNGSPAIARTVIERLLDGDATTRVCAMEVVTGVDTQDTNIGPNLIAGLAHRRAMVRAAAARTLRVLGLRTDEILRALVLSAHDSDARVRAESLHASAALFPHHPKTLRDLTTALTDPNEGVRVRAVGGLRMLGTRSSHATWDSIAYMLNDDAEAVRIAALRALRNRPEATPLPSHVTGKLLSLLSERESPETKKHVILVLGRVATRASAVQARIFNAVGCEDPDVSTTAVGVLAAMRPVPMQLLIGQCDQEPIDALRVLRTLGASARVAASAVLSLTDHGQRAVRLAALETLRTLDDIDALRLGLTRAARDRDPKIRLRALVMKRELDYKAVPVADVVEVATSQRGLVDPGSVPIREGEIPSIARAFSSWTLPQRRWVMLALFRQASPGRGLSGLVEKALHDPDLRVRQIAALVARQIPPPLKDQLVKALAAHLSSDNDGLVGDVCIVLQRNGTRSRGAIPDLMLALHQACERRENQRIRALEETLKSIGSDATKEVAERLHGSNLAFRMSLVRVLGQIGSDALNPLLGALRDRHPAVRAAALFWLCEIHLAESVPMPKGIDLMDDDFGFVRYYSARLLGELAPSDRNSRALVEGLRDKDVIVRYACVRALQKQPRASEIAVSNLASLVADGPLFLRVQACFALQKLGRRARGAVDELAAATRDRSEVMRVLADTVLRRITG